MEYDGAGGELGWEEVWGEGGVGAGDDGAELVESVGEFVMRGGNARACEAGWRLWGKGERDQSGNGEA